MSENSVIWHPYPKEKPNVPTTVKASWGEYYEVYPFLITQKGACHIKVGAFFNGEFRECDVIAWAELPEAYNEFENTNTKEGESND